MLPALKILLSGSRVLYQLHIPDEPPNSAKHQRTMRTGGLRRGVLSQTKRVCHAHDVGVARDVTCTHVSAHHAARADGSVQRGDLSDNDR